MNTTPLLLLSLAILTSCHYESTTVVKRVEPTETDSTAMDVDTTPRITGIGGIFFSSENPDSTKAWYQKNLGLKTDPYGAVFEFRNADFPDEVNYLRWSAFPQDTEYLDPSEAEFMVNYRVQNIEGMLHRLAAKGITPVDSIQSYDYGKFVHLMDPDGRKIELWEPVDSVLTQMGGVTNK